MALNSKNKRGGSKVESKLKTKVSPIGAGSDRQNAQRNQAIDLAVSTIEKQFGKGAIIKMGADGVNREVQVFYIVGKKLLNIFWRRGKSCYVDVQAPDQGAPIGHRRRPESPLLHGGREEGVHRVSLPFRLGDQRHRMTHRGLKKEPGPAFFLGQRATRDWLRNLSTRIGLRDRGQ